MTKAAVGTARTTGQRTNGQRATSPHTNGQRVSGDAAAKTSRVAAKPAAKPSSTRPHGKPPVKKAVKPAAEQISAAALPVRADEEPWMPEELAEVQVGLSADVTRLRLEIANAENEIAGLLRDSGEGAGDDQADTGTKNFEREHEMSLANNSRGMLIQAERALARIADGTYGACERCGNPIGKARLQVFPRATLCVACKQREERH